MLLSWVWLGGNRPNWKVALGLLIGFVGVYLLIGGHGTSSAAGGTGQILGAFLVIGAAFCWALGSIYGVRATTPKSSLLTSGMQMLSGGLVLTVVGSLSGEWSKFNIADVSAHSWYGLVYLIIFGSLIAFTAYSYLLKVAPPSLVATYAYINPVVAVFLGWMVGGESFTMQMLVGAGIIVGSVALITSNNDAKGVKPETETSSYPSFSTSEANSN